MHAHGTGRRVGEPLPAGSNSYGFISTKGELSMTKFRLFQLVLFAIVALCTCSQPAMAQAGHHARAKAAPKAHTQALMKSLVTGTEPAAALYPMWQGFAATPYTDYPSPFNSDGTELWYCYGNSPTANPDCPTIGDPSVQFPFDAIAVGVPQYGWPLATCDGTTTGSGLPGYDGYLPCGQAETFYEDWTEDTTDDLLYEVVITQVQGGVTQTLVDTGIEDFRAAGAYLEVTAADYPIQIIFAEDFNFGALGHTGKNNGNCFPNYNYPFDDGFPSGFYIIAANRTCVDPITGPATVTVTISLATPELGTNNSGCKIVDHNSVCDVAFITNHKVVQHSDIFIYAPPAT
jgi:hypothetical protein